MLEEDVVLLRATEPPCLSALHAKHNTTNPFGYKLGESTENNKALFSQVWKRFKLLTVPFKPLRCCLRSDKLVNCHFEILQRSIFRLSPDLIRQSNCTF